MHQRGSICCKDLKHFFVFWNLLLWNVRLPEKFLYLRLLCSFFSYYRNRDAILRHKEMPLPPLFVSSTFGWPCTTDIETQNFRIFITRTVMFRLLLWFNLSLSSLLWLNTKGSHALCIHANFNLTQWAKLNGCADVITKQWLVFKLGPYCRALVQCTQFL